MVEITILGLCKHCPRWKFRTTSGVLFKNLFGFFVSYMPTYDGRKEMFYLTTHSTHFIYGYMA